ncbi:MAG: cytochrome c biogenesis protein ResB [Luteolibacter sp.]|uniref:cytochrome c biogenesis protein ResB n=1 Tax=Luteolibacter sp. TaxID=1962973 RepID=UPI003267FC8C
MEISETPPAKAPRSLPGKIFDVLSGFGLATATLLILGLLTWFATLEQVNNGLYPTLNKYFATDWRNIFLLPELNGKTVWLPLPGGYWTCAVLLLNLILGGIIRIRKGWKHVGNLIAHFGIIFMLIGAGVTYHFSERGNMMVWPDEQSDAAEDYFEYVVEVAEIKDGKPENIHVIRGKDIVDLEGAKLRTFHLPEMPFDLELTGYLPNALPVSSAERAPDQQQYVADGYFLMAKPNLGKAEAAEQYIAGCYARIVEKNGPKSSPFILSGASYYPFSYRNGDRIFTVNMRKRLWPMPFTVRLNKFTAEFHPGTMRPKKFVSEVTRLENGVKANFTIQMNEPMRYEGLTFFQASYGPLDAMPGQTMYSVFEVVRNPADQWPKYSLIIVAIGMAVTFLIKLAFFLGAGPRKFRNV